MNLLEELKRMLAEADEADPNVDPALYTEFRNALPELIAIAEQRNAAYAAGRADQRKADVEIARGVAEAAKARLAEVMPYGVDALITRVNRATAESIAKAIEEQGKDPSP